ncbi:hypothetical protein [Halarchaeum salinum]|uniref:Phage PhiH1 repressor protein n=1 Tax=Halarchaeum salinum TaxID=489912 RepID=A0AAV3S9A8_9EURY
MVRQSADWQVLLDDRILEVFREEEESEGEAFFTPTELSKHPRINFSRQYVSERFRKLADHSLLQQVSGNSYRMTEAGRAYLRGEYDVETCKYEKEVSGENDISGASESV